MSEPMTRAERIDNLLRLLIKLRKPCWRGSAARLEAQRRAVTAALAEHANDALERAARKIEAAYCGGRGHYVECYCKDLPEVAADVRNLKEPT